MKYSEFREFLKGTDFRMVENDVMIKVIIDTFRCIVISKKAPEGIVLPYFIGKTKDFKLLEKALKLAETPLDEREEENPNYKTKFTKEEIEELKKLIELAETPLDERGEEKKYYIKPRSINGYPTKKYISLSITGTDEMSDRHEDRIFKTKFSKSEIEELKEKFDTDLRDFEIIEVED